VGGTPYITTVQAGGTWTVPVPAMTAGTTVSATVTAGGQTSAASNVVTVQQPAPVVIGPIHPEDTVISGTSGSPDGTTITIYSNGSPIGSTTVTGGAWTLSGISGLLGGESITATAGTGASESAVSNTVVVTPAAPTILAPAHGSTTTLLQPPMTGASPLNTTVHVYVDGALLGSTTTNGIGRWTFSPVADLAYGSHTIYVTAEDGLGNLSLPSATNTFTIVHFAPVVTGPISAGASSISGTSTSPDGTTITLYSGAVSIGTTTVAGGVWTVSGVSGLIGGESITATAGTGAAESAVSNTVVVTPAAPTITGPLVAGQTTVTGTSTAPVGSTVTVNVGGVDYPTTVQAGGTYSVTVPPLAGGDTVTATVTAGGQTSTITATVAHFLPPAVVGLVTPLSATISGTSGAPDGTVVTVYQDGISLGTTTVTGGAWTLSSVTGLTDGSTITATNGTGLAQSAPSPGVPVAVALLRFGGVTQLDPQIPASSAIFVAPLEAASLDRFRDLEKQVFPSADPFANEGTDLDAGAPPLIFYQVAGEDGDTLRVTTSGGKIVITH
jgi:hypothetical protein